MKKVIWIFTVMSNGVYPPGSTGIPILRPYKFQKEIRDALQPEIEVDFISYDTASNRTPVADLIVYNEKDRMFIDEETQKKALCISFQDVFSGNTVRIKNEIERHLKNQ